MQGQILGQGEERAFGKRETLMQACLFAIDGQRYLNHIDIADRGGDGFAGTQGHVIQEA